MSTKRISVQLTVHIFLLMIYLFGFSLWEASPEYQVHLTSRYAGRLEFLTNLGLLLTCLSTIFAIFEDAPTLFRKYSAEKMLKQTHYARSLHHYFLGLSFPVESFIFLMYWGLRLYDRNLISSREMLAKGLEVPVFTDLALHLFPFFGLLLDLIFFARTFVTSRFHVFSLVFFCNAYMLWCHYLFRINKSWAYPLLDGLSERQHIVLVMVATSVGLLSYYLGTRLNKHLYLSYKPYNTAKYKAQ